MKAAEASELRIRIEILKQQIELEESNYKYAVELGKDYDTLLVLREHINQQKKQFYALIKTLLEVENELNK